MWRLVIVVDSGAWDKPVSTSASSLNLPIAVRVRRLIILPDLIALAIHNENHAHRHERGRDDKNQNPTAQSLNHSSTGGGRLGVAERATLGEGGERSGEQGQSNQGNTNN